MDQLNDVREQVIDMLFVYTQHIINSAADKEAIEKALLSSSAFGPSHTRILDNLDRQFMYNMDPYFRKIVDSITCCIMNKANPKKLFTQ